MKSIALLIFAGLIVGPCLFAEDAPKNDQATYVQALMRADVILFIEAQDRATIRHGSIRAHAKQNWEIKEVLSQTPQAQVELGALETWYSWGHRDHFPFILHKLKKGERAIVFSRWIEEPMVHLPATKDPKLRLVKTPKPDSPQKEDDSQRIEAKPIKTGAIRSFLFRADTAENRHELKNGLKTALTKIEKQNKELRAYIVKTFTKADWKAGLSSKRKLTDEKGDFGLGVGVTLKAKTQDAAGSKIEILLDKNAAGFDGLDERISESYANLQWARHLNRIFRESALLLLKGRTYPVTATSDPVIAAFFKKYLSLGWSQQEIRQHFSARVAGNDWISLVGKSIEKPFRYYFDRSGKLVRVIQDPNP